MYYLRLSIYASKLGWFRLSSSSLSFAGVSAQHSPLALSPLTFLSYNFRGLRQYKEKFDPVWEPKYLASRAGLSLPRILINVTSLISGGLRGVLAR